jgi:hypothetical protein
VSEGGELDMAGGFLGGHDATSELHPGLPGREPNDQPAERMPRATGRAKCVVDSAPPPRVSRNNQIEAQARCSTRRSDTRAFDHGSHEALGAWDAARGKDSPGLRVIDLRR